DLVANRFGIFEIDRIDLEQRKIALAILGRPDLAFYRVAGAQAETADLRRADIDVVGARKIVGVRGTQETKTVGQDFDNAFAGNIDFLGGQFLEDRKHQFLFAHGRSVLDLVFFSEHQK